MTEHTHKKRVHIYSGILVIKRNEFESIEVWWMNLEPAVQGEESQKEKNKYRILTHVYMESRKIVLMNLFVGQE